MKSKAAHIEKELFNVFPSGNHQGVKNHKIAIMQLSEAIKNLYEAVKQLETGNYDEAYISAIKARGHTEHALEIQKEISKEHAIDK